MSIGVYWGESGAGKSYEVVTEVIVPSLAKGRRVVSNIYGLHYDVIVSYLVSTGIAAEKIGELVCVTNEQIGAAGFWPHEGADTICHQGDVVALDEVWQWFRKGKAINDDMYRFFREHRHGVSEQGFTGEAVLITQRLHDLVPEVRDLVKVHFRMQSKEGMVPGSDLKFYTVDIFNGSTAYKRNFDRRIYRQTNKSFFAFYESHNKDGAREVAVDQRGNLWRNPGLWALLGGGALLFVVSGIGVWRMYRHYVPLPVSVTAPAIGYKRLPVLDDGQENRVSSVLRGGERVPGPSSGFVSGMSGVRAGEWRVVGRYAGPGRDFILLHGDGGVRYVVLDGALRSTGQNVEVIINGQYFSSFGRAAGRSGGVLGVGAK